MPQQYYQSIFIWHHIAQIQLIYSHLNVLTLLFQNQYPALNDSNTKLSFPVSKTGFSNLQVAAFGQGNKKDHLLSRFDRSNGYCIGMIKGAGGSGCRQVGHYICFAKLAIKFILFWSSLVYKYFGRHIGRQPLQVKVVPRTLVSSGGLSNQVRDLFSYRSTST